MVKRWTLIFLTSGCNLQCGNVMRSPYQSRRKIGLEYMKAKQHWVGMDEDVEERTVDFHLHKGSDIRKSRVTVALKDESLPYRRVKMTTSKSANDKSVVRFIVLGNAGIAHYHENMRIDGFHAAIGDKLVSLKDSIDFIVMTGNNFLDRGVQDCNDPQWEKVWFERLRVEELNVPWFTVLGDKDMLGNPSAQYTLHKCKGKEEMSKYWITPSENYFLIIDRQVRLFFLNTNKKASKPIDRVFSGVTNEAAEIVIGHHPIDDPMHHDGTSLLRSNIIALRSRHFETYICGHDPVLKHKKEDKRSHIVVGTSGGLITWRFSDFQSAVAMNGSNGRGNTPTDQFNKKLYGFAQITIMKNSDTKQVEFFTFEYNRYGAFHWEDPIRQRLYSHDEQHSFGIN